jgi:hypothetical protein
MNRADERLRAAARTAADMFPHGGDLPPLRLAERPGARRPHASPPGRALMHRPRSVRARLAPLTAAAAVVAVVSALVVPHVIAGSPSHRKPAYRVPPAQSSASRHEQRQLDTLIVEWVAPATGPQYDRGGKMVWMLHAQELRSSARCMARQGYDISGSTSPYNLADFADNSQMPDLPRIARTHEFVSQGGFKTLDPAREQRAFNTCERAAAAPYTSLLSAYQAINQAWWKIISGAQASRQVNAAIPALQACATRYGFPNNPYGNATGPIKSFGDFMGWVAGFLDGAMSRGASDSTMRSLERHWTQVFLTCATPIVGIWQRILLAEQPGFLRQHAQQIGRLDQLAARELVQRRD